MIKPERLVSSICVCAPVRAHRPPYSGRSSMSDRDEVTEVVESFSATKKRVRRELMYDPDYDEMPTLGRRCRKRSTAVKNERDVIVKVEDAGRHPTKHWSTEKFMAYCTAKSIDLKTNPDLRRIQRSIKNRESAAASRLRKQMELDKLRGKVKKYKQLLLFSAETIRALEAKLSNEPVAQDPPSPGGSPDEVLNPPEEEEAFPIPETSILEGSGNHSDCSDVSQLLAEDLQRYLEHDGASRVVCPFME